MRHTAFFGDTEHVFILTDDMIAELERLSDLGIGALYQRAINMQFRLADLVEIIRLSLIGAGMAPQEAMRLVDTYGRNRPVAEILPLALDVLDARWSGTSDNPETEMAE